MFPIHQLSGWRGEVILDFMLFVCKSSFVERKEKADRCTALLKNERDSGTQLKVLFGVVFLTMFYENLIFFKLIFYIYLDIFICYIKNIFLIHFKT